MSFRFMHNLFNYFVNFDSHKYVVVMVRIFILLSNVQFLGKKCIQQES